MNSSKNLSFKTLKDILIILKSILKYIEQKYNLNYKLDLIPIPRDINQEKIKILNSKEISILENYCYNNLTLRNLGVLICLNTGIRIGELCALKWENIDLLNKKIIITKSIQRIYKNKNNTEIIIDSPKTKNSLREIPLSKKLFTLLHTLKKNNNYKNDMFFLTGSTTKYIEPRNFQYIFKKILKDLNLPNYKFHSLRHTFATNCIYIGMDIKSLSEILGHSNINITLNKYVHSSDNVKRKFLEKL